MQGELDSEARGGGGVYIRVAIAVGNFERGLSDSVCSCINAVKKEDTMILIIH